MTSMSTVARASLHAATPNAPTRAHKRPSHAPEPHYQLIAPDMLGMGFSSDANQTDWPRSESTTTARRLGWAAS